MRCAAKVQETAAKRKGSYPTLEIRASRDTSRRCRRNAKLWLPGAFGERGFCYQHAEIWREHNRIVQRIRDILPTDG